MDVQTSKHVDWYQKVLNTLDIPISVVWRVYGTTWDLPYTNGYAQSNEGYMYTRHDMLYACSSLCLIFYYIRMQLPPSGSVLY